MLFFIQEFFLLVSKSALTTLLDDSFVGILIDVVTGSMAVLAHNKYFRLRTSLRL